MRPEGLEFPEAKSEKENIQSAESIYKSSRTPMGKMFLSSPKLSTFFRNKEADFSQRRGTKTVGSTFFLKRPKPEKGVDCDEGKHALSPVPKAGSFHAPKSRGDSTSQSTAVNVPVPSISLRQSFTKAIRMLSSGSNSAETFPKQTADTKCAILLAKKQGLANTTEVDSEDLQTSLEGKISPWEALDDEISKEKSVAGDGEARGDKEIASSISDKRFEVITDECDLVNMESYNFVTTTENEEKCGGSAGIMPAANESPWGIQTDGNNDGPASASWKKSEGNSYRKFEKPTEISKISHISHSKGNQSATRMGNKVSTSFRILPKRSPAIPKHPSESGSDNDSYDSDDDYGALSLRSDESISEFTRRISLVFDPFVDLQSRRKANARRSKFEKLVLKAKEKKKQMEERRGKE